MTEDLETGKRDNEEEEVHHVVVDCEQEASSTPSSGLDTSDNNNKSDLEKKDDDEEESTTSSLDEEETTEDEGNINNNNYHSSARGEDDEDNGLVVVHITSELSCPSDDDDSAPDPTEGTCPTTDSSNKHDLEDKTSQRRNKKKKIIITALLIVVALILVIAVPIGVVKSKEDSKERKRKERYQKRKQETEEAQARAAILIPGITNHSLNNMWYGPQRQAYDKIVVQDPLWDTYEDWRKQQRFAMACLFYEFYPPYYRRSTNKDITISPHLHECEWIDDKSRVVATCNSRGQVAIIDWIGKKWVDGRWRQHALPLEISFLSNLRTLDCSDGIFWVGDPTDDFIDRTWDDDEAYQEGLDKYYTHPGLELVFPSAPIDHDDSVELAMMPSSHNWTLPSLEELRVENCLGLEGMAIPSTVGRLTSLTKLDLSLNELNSTVPSQIGLLTSLTSLNLHSNNLVGTLPEELGDLSQLKVLNVKENYLDEYLPTGFCREEHIAMWSQLVTDWCWVPDHCCDR